MEQKLEFKTDTKILYDIFNFVMCDELKWPDNNVECSKDRASHLKLLVKNFIEDKTREIQEKGDVYINSVIKDLEDNMSYTIKPYSHKDNPDSESNKYLNFITNLKKNNQISDTNFFRYFMLPSNIKTTLLENLSPEWKAFSVEMEKYGKFERQVSPPLSAYKYTSFNKMDITYSNKSYGLLFE